MALSEFLNQFNTGGAQQAVAGAAPQEVDAHRNLIGEALQILQGQGINPAELMQQAGVGTTNPNQMSHGDLVSTTLALARQHPEILAMVAQKFPQAQGLLSMVLGGGSPGGGSAFGGLLGGLLG